MKEALKLALEVMRNQGDVSVDEWIATEKATIEALAQPDWKAEYLRTVDLHCQTLDELREAQADLKEARHANEKHIARIVDLQTHIENFDGENR